MVHLYVKGNKQTALFAASDRQIPVEFVRHVEFAVRKANTDTILKTEEVNFDKVRAWFAEDANHTAPYPLGALLHFSSKSI